MIKITRSYSLGQLSHGILDIVDSGVGVVRGKEIRWCTSADEDDGSSTGR